MTVAGVVIETIQLMRAAKCQHEWAKLNDTEDQCTYCTVIATEEGKRRLEVMARRACR